MAAAAAKGWTKGTADSNKSKIATDRWSLGERKKRERGGQTPESITPTYVKEASGAHFDLPLASEEVRPTGWRDDRRATKPLRVTGRDLGGLDAG